MPSHDLVLLGGGHSHVLLIRQLAMQPFPDTRVTLVSEQAMTAYSGMLPGLIAGHYAFEDTHIDLNRLCRKAGVRFIEDTATGLDPVNQVLRLRQQPDLAWDTLSIDTGSTPNTADLPGAQAHAIGVKPVSRFYRHWQSAVERLKETPPMVRHWGIVGAGAGGVELALAMAWALREHPARPTLHLIYRSAELLAGYPTAVKRRAAKALTRAGVHLHPEWSVACITKDGVRDDQDRQLTLSETFLCTPASAPDWPGAAGLATLNGGFIRVNNALQSTSHPNIFAAGDIAELADMPRPKAGVYAVRQAPWLYENLRRHLAGEPLEDVQLQSSFLSLISLGGKRATGGRHGLTVSGRWVWRWKDRIDRKFMRQLNDFEPNMSGGMAVSPMPGTSAGRSSTGRGKRANEMAEPMHCAGCGSKLGPEILQSGIPAARPSAPDAALQPALGQAEDAALFRPTPGLTQVQSVDGFRAFTDDLYTFGQVAVLHALSDLYAMNASPRYVQLLLNLAYAHPRLQQRDFARLMAGIQSTLQEEQVALAGGHSTEGAEVYLGLSVSGEADAGAIWRKNGAQPDDWLVLTKPLGTGVILAADAMGAAPATAMSAALTAMRTSNRTARDQLQALNPHAVTDVTGFGLLGHLLEVLEASGCSAELWLDRVPLLDGALALTRANWQSSLYPQLRHLRQHCRADSPLSEARLRLLLDPQTSGGLLAALPGSLKESDLPGTLIGRIAGADDTTQPLVHLAVSQRPPAPDSDADGFPHPTTRQAPRTASWQ